MDSSFTVGSAIDTIPLDELTFTPFGNVSSVPHVVPDFLTVMVVSYRPNNQNSDTTNLSVVPFGVTETEPSVGVDTVGVVGAISFLIFLKSTST